jgi:uncharacterized protein YeaO (DUF488 family)
MRIDALQIGSHGDRHNDRPVVLAITPCVVVWCKSDFPEHSRTARSALMIRIKRVYEDAGEGDGRRILVDRLWPRGLAKADAAIDLWAKDVAPSTELRTWFSHRPDRFDEFKSRYLDELRSNPAAAELRRQIARKTTTLLYAAKDPVHNHAVVLAELLSGKTGRRSSAPPAAGAAVKRQQRAARR